MQHFLQAKRQGLVPKRSSGRTPIESVRYYAREFDAVGLLLLSAGLAFFLLPFNLYAQQAKGWGSAMVICFLVVGVLMLISFGVGSSALVVYLALRMDVVDHEGVPEGQQKL